MIADEFPEFGILALDADAVIAQAVSAGARIVGEARDQFYGEHTGTVRDPFGYDWMIGHSLEQVEPEEMQRRYDKMFSAE